MPEVVFPLDSTKKFTDQKLIGHNRWHPDVPTAVMVRPGDTFRVHCREWFAGAIHNDDSAVDVRDAPLSTVHVLSGPIAVEGAAPGHLRFPDTYKVIWDFTGGKATSRHVPRVEFTGIVHPGLMGTAPSAALLSKWNR